MRDRKPKPIALKILKGNPGRRPLNAAERGCRLPPAASSGTSASITLSGSSRRGNSESAPWRVGFQDRETETCKNLPCYLFRAV